MSTPLHPDDIQAALEALPGWGYEDAKLVKAFKFDDFRQALGFIVRVGLEAEVANHHPELWNVYSCVTIMLSTHDAGNHVTQKDVDLAGAIEKVAG